MRESGDPARCPACAQPARRVPSAITAFTMRDGYPRGIPDAGRPYGPITQHTTGATPEQIAEAASGNAD
jgi:hypothetical protein